MSNIYILIGNLINYGFIINPIKWSKLISEKTTIFSWIELFLVSQWFILISFCIEKFAFAKWSSKEILGFILVLFNLLIAFAIQITVILYNECHPFGAFIGCYFFMILILKLISYHMVNYWCRKDNQNKLSCQRTSEENKDNFDQNDEYSYQNICYPNNLLLCDLYYFVFAPTLCYELNYPRNPLIRKKFIIKMLLKFVS